MRLPKRTIRHAPRKAAALVAAVVAGGATIAGAAVAEVNGWLNWRGPEQTGVSRETGLPDTWAPGGTNHLWTLDLPGGGTPVIAGGRVYALGYEGQGPDLQEVLVCVDAETGKKVWERRFNDFLSDIVYDRYAIGTNVARARSEPGLEFWRSVHGGPSPDSRPNT
jgi:outer membrane protein assembly factor BamB